MDPYHPHRHPAPIPSHTRPPTPPEWLPTGPPTPGRSTSRTDGRHLRKGRAGPPPGLAPRFLLYLFIHSQIIWVTIIIEVQKINVQGLQVSLRPRTRPFLEITLQSLLNRSFATYPCEAPAV